MNCPEQIIAPIKPTTNNIKEWLDYNKKYNEYLWLINNCRNVDYRDTEVMKNAKELPTYQAKELKDKFNILYILIPLGIILLFLIIKK